MKYMVMMAGTQAGWSTMSSWSPADFQAHIQFMRDLNARLEASGELVEAHGLAMPDQAKIVKAQPGGVPAVTDGPFPESKEFLAGFWIVDVESPSRVIELAAYISAAPGKDGAPIYLPIEVREVMSAPPTDV